MLLIGTPDANNAILTHLDLKPRPPSTSKDLPPRPVQVALQDR
ncbi:MAG: hypothetical protein ACI9MR_002398 [Myxococcota bacterium]|jgi:hypothetical protein